MSKFLAAIMIAFVGLTLLVAWAVWPAQTVSYVGVLAEQPSKSEIIFTNNETVSLTLGSNGWFPQPLKVGATYNVTVQILNGGNIVFEGITELPSDGVH